MHGIRRSTRIDPEATEHELERSSFLAGLIRRALVLRHKPLQPPFDEHFGAEYSVAQRALETNPDEYTLWAFRREVLLAKCEYLESVENDWLFELDLTMRALRRHPKAYPAWQHRLWLFENDRVCMKVSVSAKARALDEEEKLSAIMLSKDGRNFHGWAHRMRVRHIRAGDVAESNDMLRKELDFVEHKINIDFANYSAWHQRSALLAKIYRNSPERFLNEELQFVRQAFYTEPDVQSAWFYHRWLLAGAPAKGKAAVVLNGMLADELASCEELLELEPEARYALQTKVHILNLLGRASEAVDALDTLEQIDPMRKGYYKHLRNKNPAQQVNEIDVMQDLCPSVERSDGY